MQFKHKAITFTPTFCIQNQRREQKEWMTDPIGFELKKLSSYLNTKCSSTFNSILFALNK
jgi:hypothetical protein